MVVGTLFFLTVFLVVSESTFIVFPPTQERLCQLEPQRSVMFLNLSERHCMIGRDSLLPRHHNPIKTGGKFTCMFFRGGGQGGRGANGEQASSLSWREQPSSVRLGVQN